MKTAVIIFPGSNCDRDMLDALRQATGKEPHKIWHADPVLPQGLDLIAVPGGFSYGDYLRSGAIAAHSPVMKEVIQAANRGVHVLGVCNGFQVLTEAGLLPGVLMRNRGLRFVCKTVELEAANTNTVFTSKYKGVAKIPVAHHDGNYFIDADGLKALEGNGQVAFRYVNNTNPNGSIADIAGVFNAKKNVLGMMPHPERAVDANTGGMDGKVLFDSLLAGI
jgi:phosphoribosylformylglycinamidine synthase I